MSKELIEQLAKEHGFHAENGSIKLCPPQYSTISNLDISDKLEAFAKSYQATMPDHIVDANKMLVNHLVNKFLGWKLPTNFNPDSGIVFGKQRYDSKGNLEDIEPSDPFWPIGTNLFTADQAKAMFEYCLDGYQATITEQDTFSDVRLEGLRLQHIANPHLSEATEAYIEELENYRTTKTMTEKQAVGRVLHGRAYDPKWPFSSILLLKGPVAEDTLLYAIPPDTATTIKQLTDKVAELEAEVSLAKFRNEEFIKTLYAIKSLASYIDIKNVAETLSASPKQE